MYWEVMAQFTLMNQCIIHVDGMGHITGKREERALNGERTFTQNQENWKAGSERGESDSREGP